MASLRVRLAGLKSASVACLFALPLVKVSPVAGQDSFMLVSSRNTHAVKMYDGKTGQYVRDFVESGSGGLSTTQDILWGHNGNLLVTGRLTNQVLEFDGETGEFIGPFTSGYELDNPTKMSFGPDEHLYVSQWGTRDKRFNVARFDGETGVFIDEFSSDNPGLGCGHAWDVDGNMYLAGYGAEEVLKYAPGGDSAAVFTTSDTLHGPVNVWFDPFGGDILVADWPTGQIARFDSGSGAFKGSFVADSALVNVEGFAYGPDGYLYLADWTNSVIKRFDPRQGSDEGVFASGGGLEAPNAILFGPAPQPAKR